MNKKQDGRKNLRGIAESIYYDLKDRTKEIVARDGTAKSADGTIIIKPEIIEIMRDDMELTITCDNRAGVGGLICCDNSWVGFTVGEKNTAILGDDNIITKAEEKMLDFASHTDAIEWQASKKVTKIGLGGYCK